MVSIVTINDDLYERYSSYTKSNTKARFGHDLEWALALHDTYGVSIEHLVALDGENVVGVCPLFLCKPIFGGAHYQTSLFPSYFGPLYDSDDVLNAILEEINKRTSQLQYTEILSPEALPIPAIGFTPFVENLDSTFLLSLSDGIDAVFNKFSRDIKRILRKEKDLEEVKLVVDTEGKFVLEFYKLYVSIYAHKHGFIPHVKRLFENIFLRYPNGQARIYLVEINRKFKGGIFTFCRHNEIYYAWSAVRPDSVYHPTHFLIWKIIQDGIAEGFPLFNMGESQIENEGLTHFKKGWGTEMKKPIRYFIPGQETYPSVRLFERFSWAHKIIARLPTSVITGVLSPAIRYFL
jgi:hypothetical protein